MQECDIPLHGPFVDLRNLHGTNQRRQSKAKPSARPRLKPLSKMSEREVNALPEREFLRLLDAATRRAYRAAKKLKGRL
jgi:hypothetical protein